MIRQMEDIANTNIPQYKILIKRFRFVISMKRVSLIFIVFFIFSNISAQNNESLLQIVNKLDASITETDYNRVMIQLEKYAKTDATNWLAQYYVSLGFAFMSAKNMDHKEINIDKAIKYMLNTKLLNLNDEVLCLESFVYSVKMSKSPYTRWLAYKSKIVDPLEKAKEINANNSRIYILLASIQKNIPQWLGGGCDAAKKYIEMASSKWNAQNNNSLQPHWGQGTLASLKEACAIN